MKKILKKRFLVILSCLFLLSMLLGYAKEDFEVKIEQIVDRISIDDVAEYNVTIYNNRVVNDEFRIYILAYPEWELRTEPLTNPITLEVPQFSKRSIKLSLNPLHVTSVGNFQIDLFIQSLSTNKVLNEPLEVKIKSTSPLIEGYVPTVLLNLDIPKKIDPREKVKVKVILANQNLLDYPEIIISIKSNLINDKITEKLGPKEDKVIEIYKEFPKDIPPQNDSIIVTLQRGNRTIDTVSKNIEVISYSSIKENSNYQKKFLKGISEVTFTNDGNVVINNPLKVRTERFKALFTITKPRAEFIEEDGINYYVWKHSIYPDEKFEVVLIENYRQIFLLFIIGIISVIIYYSYRPPIMVKKSIKDLVKLHGGISELQISLSLKNRASSSIDTLSITDSIPDLVHLERGLLIGTLHPTKILRHERKGTIVKWDIKSLDSAEERVITYKIKTRLPILGGVTLPSANVKFSYHGKNLSVNSNNLKVKIE